MKKWMPAIVLSVPVLSFMVSSCCKSYCYSSEIRLAFVNYPRPDVDTIFLISYQNNGQFDRPIDSFYSYTWYPDSSRTVHFLTDKSLDRDYLVRLPSTGKEYRISDIKKKRQRCNCGHGSIDRIGQYKVDGHLSQTEEVVLN